MSSCVWKYIFVKKPKYKKESLDLSQATLSFVCAGAQLVDKCGINGKIHCLCSLSTYYLRLSTYLILINCTFATEN